MPGILCSVHHPDDAAIEPKWRRGLELATHHPEHVLEQYGEPGFHLACLYHPDVCAGPRMLVTEDHVLAWYGNVYEDAWAGATTGEGLCRVLLDAYRTQGVEALEHLNGRYDIAVWDRRLRELHFVSDRFGANRHYYLRKPGSLQITCEVKALAPMLGSIDVDPAGLASMLTFGYHIGDLTIIKGVKCLPNACQLEYQTSSDHLRVERYWDYPYGETETLDATEDELAEALHGHLMTALKRQLRGVSRILLPISGGMDSRTLAGLLHQSEFTGEVIAYSYGQPSSNDVRYGRAIARKLGYQHIAIPSPTDFLTRHLEDAAWRFDAEWSAKNAWIRYAHKQPGLLGIHGGTLLHGLMGDIILGSDLFGYRQKAGNDPQPIAGLRKIFLNCHVSYMRVQEISKIFSDDLAARTEAQLNSIIDATLAPLLSLNPYFALMRAEFEHRQRRRTAWLIRCAEADLPAITPFMDRDVVDFSTRIPYALYHDKRLYKHMVRQHLPKLASIPLSDTGLPLSPTRFRAAMAWRIERLFKPISRFKNQLNKRREMLDFNGSLREQTNFFRSRLCILEELSPPLPSGAATSRMEKLLSGAEHPSLQACALLPPALFLSELRAQVIGASASFDTHSQQIGSVAKEVADAA